MNQCRISLETIAKGNNCGCFLPKKLVIEEKSEWTDLWSLVYSKVIPKPKMPKINFNNYQILAVFMGTKNSGGYNINIDNAMEMDDHLEIFISESTPNRDGFYTAAFTSPYHIVKIKKMNKEVRYV